MKVRQPAYYERFQCAAGSCPDTCCAAWDIVIDPASLAFYQALDGELGDRIRAAITVDGEGDPCFRVSGGCCPLLTEERLCTVQLALGEERVCETCRSHPRFTEEYGWFRERALAASCPAAAELILQEDFALEEREDGEEGFVCEDVDEELLRGLLPLRERAFGLLARGEWTWTQRLYLLLLLGTEAQLALSMDGPAALTDLAELWAQVDVSRMELPELGPEVVQETRRRCVDLLGELEVLDESWARDLSAYGTRTERSPVPEEWEHRWACYLLWRWFLRADFDGEIYGKLALPVLSLLTLRELSGGENWAEWARRWAKEVEHSAENLSALYEALSTEPALAPERLIGAL